MSDRSSDSPGAGKRRTALVTGSSSGIGAAFARKLASQGYDLVLVARREDRLTALATDLRQQHSVRVETLVADLSDTGDIQLVEGKIIEFSPLDMLINNAGFGLGGGVFAKADLAKHLNMIQVHVVASVRLTRAALPAMIANHYGAIVNLSSTAAFLPWRGDPTYSATKAYLVMFSQVLHTQLLGTGVKIQALCPGYTYTEFHDTSEMRGFDRSKIPRSLWMSPEEVVAESFKALERGKVVCIPGFRNRLIVGLARNSLTSPLIQLAAKRTIGQATRARVAPSLNIGQGH